MFEKICVIIVCIEIGIVAFVIVLFFLDTWIENAQFRKHMKVGDVGSVKMGDAGYCVCDILEIDKITITVGVLRRIKKVKKNKVCSKDMAVEG